MELRQAIAAHLKRLYGVQYDPPTEIVITVGVSEALYLTMTALLDPGDEVIIPTPCFVSYQAEVILAGGVPVEIPSRMENNFHLDPDAVRAAITPRTKAIFIGYPNNPTGAVATAKTCWSGQDRRRARPDRHLGRNLRPAGLRRGARLLPGAGRERQARTILLGGFSKDYAMTGWRIGYAAGPEDIIDGLVRIHQYTIMSAPTMAQMPPSKPCAAARHMCRRWWPNTTAAAS